MGLPNTKSSFTFNHSGQPDGLGAALQGDFATIQQKFDSRGEELRLLVNSIITALKATTVGDSGAKNIKSQAVGDIAGDNVYDILVALNELANYETGTDLNGNTYVKYANGQIECHLASGALTASTSQNGVYVGSEVTIDFPFELVAIPIDITFNSALTTGDWFGIKITSVSTTQIKFRPIGMVGTTAGSITLIVRGWWK